MRCRPGDGRWPGTADSAELRVVIAIPPSDLGWALLANCSPHGRPAPGLTGALGSGLLEEAERAGLFLIPLDEVRGWWRYHHLFASLLRARLQEEQPGWVPKLHHNAAAWYAGCGLADDAIGHSVAAGETAWAARIIEQHFDMVYNIRGEAATHPPVAVGPARRGGQVPPPAVAGAGNHDRHQRPPPRRGTAPGRGGVRACRLG